MDMEFRGTNEEKIAFVEAVVRLFLLDANGTVSADCVNEAICRLLTFS